MYESGNKGKECLLSKLLLLTKIIVDKCAIVDNYSVIDKNSEVYIQKLVVEETIEEK